MKYYLPRKSNNLIWLNTSGAKLTYSYKFSHKKQSNASDETKIDLYQSGEKYGVATQVWKREGRAYHLSSGKVIAWTCMSANGARPVVFLADTTVDSRINSEVQRAMLSNEI